MPHLNEDGSLDMIFNDYDLPYLCPMIEDETDHILRELEQQMMYQGMNIDMYMSFLGKDMGGLRDEKDFCEKMF